ncbi:hypothetical protein Taro_054417 [Colocasia esculenta]|uniref:Aminotransferase-like plant mobile domain-containing protein n=1 Tax=Colocasia esculenta TaxID=4460 RepID=A0A843XR49_COLES|nr:hypothetical protein [Colocasia esculenta]
MTNWVDNAIANKYFIDNEETEWMHTANVQVDNLIVYNIQSNEELHVGDLFARKKDLVTKISLWSVKRNVQFRTDRSTSKILTLICYANSQCQWRLHACCSKRAGGAWKITSYESHHSCHTPIENQRHRQLTSSVISRLILPVIIWEPYVLEELSNVAAICRESSELWQAHVPIFCMAVMEVHTPKRVWRQFGAPQVIPPAPDRYDRKDGRGYARENWLLYHARNIERWNDRANTILEPPTQEEDQSQWRQWYGQQSNLYLSPFSEEPPTEYCPRGPIERALVDVTFCTRELLIINPEASYLDVKKEILKLQKDTLNKLRIKIPEYEQPLIPFGAEYTLGESSEGPNIWAHPWTSEQWPIVYDA